MASSSSSSAAGPRVAFTTPADGATLKTPVMAERFLPLFLETVQVLRGERRALTSDGENALQTQLLIDGIADHLAQ